MVALRLEPSAILAEQRRQRDLGGGAVRELAKRIHGEVRALHFGGFGSGHARGADPRRSHRATGAVPQVPIRRHAVAGGVLGRIGVVQVSHLVVPLRALRSARIRARHERPLAAHFQLRLKREGGIRRCLLFRWFALVHQERGDGAGAGGQARQLGGVQPAFAQMDAKAIAVRHGVGALFAKRQTKRLLVRRAPPRGLLLGVVAIRRLFGFGEGVVSPADDDVQRVHVLRHQKAEADGGWKEAALGGAALFRRLFRQCGRRGGLVQLVVFVRVRALFGRRAGGHQEAGEIPVRGAHPAGQAFLGELVARWRADEIDVQGFGEAGADFGGGGGNTHGNRV